MATSSDSGPASLSRQQKSANLRLEDVFHMTSGQHLGSPASHTAHVFRGQLNYILLYHSTYLRQEVAFRIRDEVVDILRMATERAE